MGVPQDWAPYSSVEDAAKVYLRDPDLALDQVRSVVDLSAIKSFIMSRGFTEESPGGLPRTLPSIPTSNAISCCRQPQKFCSCKA